MDARTRCVASRGTRTAVARASRTYTKENEGEEKGAAPSILGGAAVLPSAGGRQRGWAPDSPAAEQMTVWEKFLPLPRSLARWRRERSVARRSEAARRDATAAAFQSLISSLISRGSILMSSFFARRAPGKMTAGRTTVVSLGRSVSFVVRALRARDSVDFSFFFSFSPGGRN